MPQLTVKTILLLQLIVLLRSLRKSIKSSDFYFAYSILIITISYNCRYILSDDQCFMNQFEIYQQNNFIMTQDNSRWKSSNLEQFHSNLYLIYESMLLCQKNGKYTQAQALKQKAYQYRKKWEESTLDQMDRKFNQTMGSLQEDYNNDLDDCNKNWSKALDDYAKECRNYIDKTDQQNSQEINQLRKTLNEQLPSKVKQSYQLLNLREMEYHMSKQKDFNQAHLIQNQIRQTYNRQLAAWNEDKSKKIEQAVANLKNKHSKQRDLFNKRMQIQMQDYNNNWHQQKIMLNQRFNNNSKELKANHQRQVGSFKKQFKTKGGQFSTKYQQGILTD